MYFYEQEVYAVDNIYPFYGGTYLAKSDPEGLVHESGQICYYSTLMQLATVFNQALQAIANACLVS